jgi:hypothetical protein
MKIINPGSIFYSLSFYTVIAINAALIYVDLDIEYSIPAFLAGNILGYLVGITDQYRFEYDDKIMRVTNAWNPFVKSEFKVSALEKIECNFYNGVGFGIAFYSLNGSKDVYGCSATKDELMVMVNEINTIILRLKNQEIKKA